MAASFEEWSKNKKKKEKEEKAKSTASSSQSSSSNKSKSSNDNKKESVWKSAASDLGNKATASKVAKNSDSDYKSITAKTASFEEWSKKKKGKAYESRTINDWVGDSTNTLKRVNSYAQNYSSADDGTYESLSDEIQNLLSETMTWRRKYADNDEAMKSIDEVAVALSDAMKSKKSIRDYWSQWNSEDEYTEWKTATDEHERLSNLDIEETEKYLKQLNSDSAVYKQYKRHGYADAMAELDAKYEGGVEQAANEISKLTGDLSNAKRIQKGVELAGAVDAEDFGEFSKYTSTFNEDAKWYEADRDEQYEFINDKDFQTKYMADHDLNPGGKSGFETYSDKNYQYMDENEIAIYNYYYAKEGKEKAQEYLDSIQESLNVRSGNLQFGLIKDNNALELLFGVEAGLDQFHTGLENLFNDDGEYRPTSSTQIASGLVREDMKNDGALWGVAYDVVNTSANQIPSILASIGANAILPGAGAFVGTGLMSASAGGNAYQEMLNLGYSKDQATNYAVLVGASEGGLQYLLGGISSLGGKASGHWVTKVLSKFDGAFARTAATIGINMASEGLEEGLQEILEPWFKSVVTGTDFEAPNVEDVLYASLLGALTAGLMEGPSTIADTVATRNTGKKIQNSDISLESLKEMGSKLSADSVAYRLAGKVNDKTGAYEIGRLFNEMGATITEMNQQDITNALVAKGYFLKNAETIAKTLADVSNGAELTRKQIKILNANEDVSEVIKSVILDKNSTAYQRSLGYNEALMKLAQEKVSKKASQKASNASTENEMAMDEEIFSQKPKEEIKDKYAEAESRKTIRTSDGAEVNIKSVASVKDGVMTFNLDDGTTATASELELGGTGVIYSAMADMGVDAISANMMMDRYKFTGGVSPATYARGITEAYRYGQFNYPIQELAKAPFASELSYEQATMAHRIGKLDAGKVIAKETAIQRKKGKAKTTRQGKVYFTEGGKVSDFRTYMGKAQTKLKDIQETAVVAMEQLSAALGVDFYVFESYEKDGKRFYIDENGNEAKAPNGKYIKGKIYVDLHAGNTARGTMLFTVAHELTHFIKAGSLRQFKRLANILNKYYGEKGVSVEARVQEQIKKAKANGRDIGYDEAFEEYVADSMESVLADGRVMELLADIKKQDTGLWNTIKGWFADFTAKLKNLVSAYEGVTPDSKEGRFVAEAKDLLAELQQVFAEGLVEASENMSVEPGESGTIYNAKGDPVAFISEEGSVQLSMRTYEESGREEFKKYLEKCVKSKRLTKAEMAEMRDGIEQIYETCKEFKDKYAPFGTWSEAEVITDEKGKPVFSVVTPNGEYKMNLDFSLVCKKRRTLDAVFNEMAKRGIIDDFELGQKSVVKINEIIRKHGLETACALCFVDAKRFRQAAMADMFVDLYNDLVYSLVPAMDRGKIAHFNFSGNQSRADVPGIHEMKNSELDFSHVDEVMKKYGSGTVEYKAAAYIKKSAEARKLLQRGDFMSSGGFDAVKVKNKTIMSLYNSKKGTGGPKAAFGDAQYLNEVIKKARFWTPKKAYSVGGVRIQSFSDYVPRMVFDYVQMVYDLAATKLPAHAYTKEAMFAKQFGLTGIKINMSLIPTIAEGGIAPGLDANGDYVWAGESFDFETAKQIQNAEGYTENCGTICVGVSYEHIRKLLSDPDIRMVIPYHKSGLNPIVAKMNKVAAFTDYTSMATNPGGCQNTVDKEGKKVEKDFDFNGALRETGDPKAAVQKYFEWCSKNNYTPRFAEFAWHENYYKLIDDFTLYDMNMQYVPQHEVRAVFPTEDSAFGSMKSLIKSALEEDAIVEGKRDSALGEIVDEIQQNLPRTEDEIPEVEVEQADRDLEADAKYSVREEFPREIEQWDRDGRPDEESFVLGSTGDVIQGLGAMESDIYMHGEKMNIIMNDHPEITIKEIKKIPQILENPVLILKSRNVRGGNANTRMVVFGSVKAQNGLPMLAVLDLRPVENNLVIEDMQKVSSAYTKDNNPVDFLKKSDVMYADKKRTTSLLRTIGFQMPIELNKSGFTGSISYIGQKVKLKGVPFDEVVTETKYSDRDSAPTFYSHMGKVIDDIKPQKMGATGVVSYLKGKGVKNEEIKWSGIEAFLEGRKSVTKEELQEFVAGSMLEIEEQERSGGVEITLEPVYASLGGESNDVYVMQGGEILDTLEWDDFNGYYVSDAIGYSFEDHEEILDYYSSENGGGGNTRWGKYKLDGGENYRELVFKIPNSEYSNNAMKAHWGEDAQGILAHARMQDMAVNGGKMLFIEEIQSDWHNEGHKTGYVDESKRLTVSNTEVRHEGQWYNLYHNGKDLHQGISETFIKQRFRNGISEQDIHSGLVDEYNRVTVERKNGVELVPDAPFRDTYHEYAMKRLIRMAAEQGYDIIGWTPSEIQVDRWSDEFEEGYRIEYDQDIPKFMNKYGKKWGAKVGTTTLSNGTEVWSMPITDSMKQSVLSEGQPLYQDRPTESVSNRSLLANAFEGLVQTDIERNKIQEYRERIAKLNEEEKKLQDLNRQIKEISFGEGPRDKAKLSALREEAMKTANRINIHDQKLLSLEAAKPLQDVLGRAKSYAYKQGEKNTRQAMDAYRARVKENSQRTEMRHKIKRVVNDLNRYLLSGTKDKHVPIQLQAAVAEALDVVNMDTVGAEQRIAKLKADLMKAKTPEQAMQITETIKRIEAMGDRMNDRLNKLKTAYDTILSSDDPMVANAHDEVISSMIESVSQKVGDTALRDMDMEQLEEVHDLYTMVLTKVKGANESFADEKKKSISSIASVAMMELGRLKRKKKVTSASKRNRDSFSWNNLKPVYAFERIGSSALTNLFKNVRKGEDVWATDMTEAKAFHAEKAKKYGYDSWDLDKRYEFESTSGLKFDLNTEEIMALYAYSKRGDQAKDHLKHGGFVHDPQTELKQKKLKFFEVKKYLDDATAYNISDETLEKIIGTLSEEQKGFVDEMQDYLSDVMGAKGNEVSLAMYAVKLFKEKSYFPLKSAPQYMEKAREAEQGDVKIKNKGFTKQTVPKAKNPIVLSSFMDVWADHVNEMSLYHAFTLPLEDFYRVYNYRTPSNDPNLPTEGVNPYIINAHGKAATQYIEQLLKDINGGAISDSRETVAKSLMGKFKKAAVFSSLSVVIQQPSAIGRAFAYLNPLYFKPTKDGMNHKELWAEVKKYAPVAAIKEMGYFDTGMGRSARDFLKDTGYEGFWNKAWAVVTDGNYRDEILSILPALADELTWCAIWNATKRDIMKKQPHLSPKSEEFLKLVGERFTEVVTKTQVYDSVMARSANMRSKGAFMNMWTSFMAEPTTSINMIEDAIRKGDKRFAVRALSSVATSVVLNSALVALVYAARDDDEDETFLEKYLSSFVTETIDGFNPLTYYPGIKDMWSALQGFDIERADMSLVTKLFDSVQQWVKVVAKDTDDMDEEELAKYKEELNEAVWSVVDNISSLAGLPVKNIRRDFVDAVGNVIDMVNSDTKFSTGSLGDNLVSNIKNTIPVWGWLPDEQKSDKLYKAMTSGDTAYVERLESSYKDENSYNNALKKALRDNDARIKQAAEARYNADFNTYQELLDQIVGEGNFDEDVVIKAIEAEMNKLKPKEESETKKGAERFNMEDFYKAAKSGDVLNAEVMRKVFIDELIEEGYLKHEAEESVASSFVTKVKNVYLDGDVTKSEAKSLIKRYGDKTEDEASTEIKKCDFELKHGYSWGARVRGYRLKDISKSELMKAVMDIEGESREGAEEYIKFLDLEMKHQDFDINASDAAGYFEYAEPAGISVDVYLDYKESVSGLEGDKDENGKTISGSKKTKILAAINALPISSAQKDALYYANDYKESKLYEAPWH